MSSSTNLAREERFRPQAGSGLAFVVGFFFAFRLFILLLSVWTLGADPQTGVEASLGVNFALLGVVAFDSLGGPRRGKSGLLRMPSVRWALFFLGFSCCSLLWSSAVSLPAAGAFWCGMAADTAIVILLLRARPAEEIAHALMKGYVCGACLIATIAWVLPAQSDMRLGYEDLLGPNQIGYLCAFGFFFAQYVARTSRGPWSFAMALLGVTLLRSLSKTTIVAFLAGETFLLVRDRSIRRRTKVLLGLGTLFVVLVFWNLLSSYYDIYTNAGNQSETLTGRIGLWAVFLDEAVQRPLIGHGFHSVWKVIPPYGPEQFEARHAHNELLQQFYAYGVMGLVMLAGIYGSVLLQIRKMPRNPRRTFFLSFLLFIVIRGFADTEPFDLSLPLWSIVLISMLMVTTDATGESTAVASLSQRSVG
jgi:O-antigen ligase